MATQPTLMTIFQAKNNPLKPLPHRGVSASQRGAAEQRVGIINLSAHIKRKTIIALNYIIQGDFLFLKIKLINGC